MKTSEFFHLKKYMQKRNEGINQLPPDILGSKVCKILEKMKMTSCCHRRQYPTNCISAAGKASNALNCARVSDGEMTAFSPEFTQRTKSWSVFLIYIINLISHIKIMDLLEKQAYWTTKNNLTINKLIYVFYKNKLACLFK